MSYKIGVKERGSLNSRSLLKLKNAINFPFINHAKVIKGRIVSYPYGAKMDHIKILNEFCVVMGWEFLISNGYKNDGNYNPENCLKIVIQKIGD